MNEKEKETKNVRKKETLKRGKRRKKKMSERSQK